MLVSLGRALRTLYGGLLIDSGSYKILFASVFGIMIFFVCLTLILNTFHLKK